MAKTRTCRSDTCGKESPAGARFCMHCGKSLNPPKDWSYTGEMLEVSKSADLSAMLDHLTSPAYGGTRRGVVVTRPFLPTVRRILTEMSSRRSQRFIRFFGLDGKAGRSVRDMADEEGVSLSSIRNSIDFATLILSVRLEREGYISWELDK